MLESAKTNYYKTIIQSLDENQLFKLEDRMFHHNKTTPLPKHDSPQRLAEAFSEHFVGKIQKLRNRFSACRISQYP